MDFHGLFWLIVFALAFRYGLPWFFARQKKKRLVASGIAEIDRMDGLEFEQYLEVLFGKLGYRVRRTQYVGDYGADLIIEGSGVKTVIQAKRYAKAVGIQAVQEAVAAKGMYGCTEAMVVTNSTFTRAAVELARANHLVLWDRNRLVETILRVQGEAGAIPQAPPPPVLQPPASQPPTPQPLIDPRAGVASRCVTCGVQVSERVLQYCRAHPQWYGGAIYCFEHQKVARCNTV